MALSEFYYKRLLERFKFEPTNGQKELFEALAGFMDDGNISKLLLVTGFAGTGKTSALNAFISLLKQYRMRYVLLAPTGRAAKVLANYTGAQAQTIHKQIYRQKSMDEAGGSFSLDYNKFTNTVFIVDEASLIAPGDAMGTSIFGSGNLLDDLINYVTSNTGNRLILLGDPAQLPPIGYDHSPALEESYVASYMPIYKHIHLTEVVRQAKESGILYNATLIRTLIERNDTLSDWKFKTDLFPDIEKINGGDLIEALSDAIDKYGTEEVVVLCRSNKRANRYNAGIRERILYKDEMLCRDDRLMVVKNCYKFADALKEDIDFIANGDVAVLQRVWEHEERYGLHFASAELAFPDYNNIEIRCKIILDTLSSESPSLNSEQQKALFTGVYEDYSSISTKKKRLKAVREDPYYNALQVKYAMAITGHKSQGGQWKCVFIDNNLWSDNISLDDLKWLYTAITRGIEKVYLVNFKSV